MDSNSSSIPPSASGDRRKHRFLLTLAAVSIGVSGAGFGATVLIKSPQQVAAEAGPPEASVISVPVERRVLREVITLRGLVESGQRIEVSPVASDAVNRMVVSAPPLKVGRRVKAGQVVAVVSGRPIIALRGRVPAYRDLVDGFKGPDVEQLQKALREIGYPVGDAVGSYGASTRAAVRKLFTDRGFEPVGQEMTTILRSGEVVFVPEFPARVTAVNSSLGSEVKGMLLKLAAGELVVTGSLSPTDRKLVKAGKPVTIHSEESGRSVKGVIDTVGPFVSGQAEGSEGASPQEPGHPITVRGVRPLSEGFAGQDVRLTINAASTDRPVLVVPSSAVYATADGSFQLIKMGPGGEQARVSVTTGTSAGGFVEIETEEVREGDLVVVGTR